MPSFVYEARDRVGKASSGTLEADTPALAAAKLRELGLFVTSLRQRGEAGTHGRASTGSRMKLRDLAILTRQWAVMIRAGLNLVTCLRTLFMQTSNPRIKSILGQIRQDVEAGQPLATALGRHPGAFSPMFVHMVEAGETSGQLDTVLDRLADNTEKEYGLRRKIFSAMTYPAVIIVVVIGVVGFMVTFIIPRFAMVFAESGQQLPALTRFVVGVSNVVKSLPFLIAFPAVTGGSAFALVQWRKTPEGHLALDRFFYRLPIFGAIVQKVACSRFTRTFGTLIESGVSIVPSLEIVERAAGNAVVARAVAQARISISQGQGMARPLAETRVFPPMLTEMVAIGEETGALEKMLSQVADFYDSEVETAVAGLTAMLEPMIVVFLGAVVGFLVIAIVLPMMDIGTLM